MRWCDNCEEAQAPKWVWEYIQPDEAVRMPVCPVCGEDLVAEADQCPLCGGYKRSTAELCPRCYVALKNDMEEIFYKWINPQYDVDDNKLLEVINAIYKY